MMKFAGFVGLIGLVACGDKGSDSGAVETGDTTGSQTCGNTVSDTFPIDGANDAFYRTNVEFTLVTAEPDATIDVTDAAGAAVAGTTTIDANRVVWTPSTALSPSTAYTATLNWSCTALPITFTTTATGAPVGDPGSLTNNTYQLSLADGRFVQPPGIGELIGGLITVDVLMMVSSSDATSMHFMGAVSCPPPAADSECGLTGDTSTQDLCTPSIDFPADADFTQNPFFSVGPDTTTLSVAGFDITVTDLAISGAFTADGQAIQGAALAGSIDTRPLVDLVASGQGDDGVCNLVSTFGISCIDCADGSGQYCLAISVEDMTATLLPGLQLQSIDEATATANTDAATCVP